MINTRDPRSGYTTDWWLASARKDGTSSHITPRRGAVWGARSSQARRRLERTQGYMQTSERSRVIGDLNMWVDIGVRTRKGRQLKKYSIDERICV
ncbi:hypothetical protein K438DRAFT_1862001 [Mycena galopus ATCC 62051]|nr:hypothetical protein K438DRAFT_1862001 [Mycena galopus ATCC 62051]